MSAPTCRPGCAACCIAPSISSALPGLPHGKPAGMPCPHLDVDWSCRLFGRPERPAVCASLQPSADMCGDNRDAALFGLAQMERQTRPAIPILTAASTTLTSLPARTVDRATRRPTDA